MPKKMQGMASTQKPLGPFPLGMDNRAPDFKLKLPEEAGHLLRDALNVDVTAQGSVKTRAGYALAESGLDCHSAWSPVDGAYGLYCDAGDVYRMDVDSSGAPTRTQIAAGYGRVTPVVFAEVNEAVYFTDGIRVGSYHPVPGPTPRWLDAMPRMVGDVQFSAMPAGSALAYHGGRLLVALGSALIYSEPFTPNLRDESRGFEIFPAPITCMAAVEDGIFVMADKTYFLPGGMPAEAMRAVLSYGALQQQPGYRPDGGAHWMSERGIVSAQSNGSLVNLQEQRIAMQASGSSSTLYREEDGMRSIVAALSHPPSIAAGVGSYAQAKLVRKANP